MSAILNAALEYAEHGFSVFPARRSDKAPLTQHGLKDASKDPEQIRQWWKMFPDANVAIALGKPSGDVFALDIDVKADKRGDELIRMWQAVHGDFPNTVTAVTGSGGMHLYFRLPGIERYKNKVEAIEGVDIRGDGAYVVAPPSIYEDGRTYSWENGISIIDDEIADANQSVIELLELNRKDVEPERKPAQKTSVRDVREGQRNDTVFRYASAQRGQDVPIEVTMTAARELNSQWPEPLSEHELRKTVESAYRYEPNETTIYGEASQQEPSEEELEAPTVDEFDEEEVEWIIPGWLPRGQITMLCGTGGTGKTSLWVSLIASLSSGERSIFNGTDPYVVKRESMKILFFSAEDTVENVIKKKLRAAGANMKNIRTVSLTSKNFEKIHFGSKYLEGLFRKYRPDLCVFDPIQNFVGSRIKMSDRNAIRQNMRTLIEWGSLYGTASLVVMHTNKLSNVWGRQRMADSADLWDIARCVWMVGDADSGGMKYLSHEKSNYGQTCRTMLFQNSGGLPRFYSWSEKKDRDFVLEASKQKNAHEKGDTLQDVCNAILSELAECEKGMVASDLDSLMIDLGYKKWQVKKAKTELKNSRLIKYEKPVEMGGNWIIKIVK